MDLKQHIRNVPDFPKAGILFYDITTLLREPQGFAVSIDMLAMPYVDQGIDAVIGIESRGFILGAAVAHKIGAGFIPIRKPGKLPAKAIKETYDLEYGTDALEIHEDAVRPGQRVLIVDDVLATGGTAAAAVQLVHKLGGELHGLAVLIELLFLNGRSKLGNENVHSVVQDRGTAGAPWRVNACRSLTGLAGVFYESRVGRVSAALTSAAILNRRGGTADRAEVTAPPRWRRRVRRATCRDG